MEKSFIGCLSKFLSASVTSWPWHRQVMLDVVNVNRKLLKEKYTNFVTNFRKDTSSLAGGYLVCDGRGFPVTFAVHHAPPHVAKLAIFKPSLWKPMPDSQPSEVGRCRSRMVVCSVPKMLRVFTRCHPPFDKGSLQPAMESDNWVHNGLGLD